jgi:predicted dehydrogenase
MKSPVLSRRQFLRNTAIAALSVPFLGSLAARAADPESRKLGFALVGLGGLSNQQIAPALQLTKYCRLAGIVTGTPSKIPIWKNRYKIPDKNVYNYDTMEQMADNPDIDVVYIVTPNGLHAEHSIKAAKAGKHVFCEKPFEATVEKCQAAIDACKKADRLLAVAYRCQYDPNHLERRRLAMEKVFGELKTIAAGFSRTVNVGEWRLNKNLAGGGPLMDVGIYALQTCRFVSAANLSKSAPTSGPSTIR